MSRRLAALVLAPVLAVGVTLGTAMPASADTPGCVTRKEYRAVTKGMSKSAVHAKFDTAGKRQAIATTSGYTVEIRSYRTCSPYSAVSISYENGRLSAKSA